MDFAAHALEDAYIPHLPGDRKQRAKAAIRGRLDAPRAAIILLVVVRVNVRLDRRQREWLWRFDFGR